VNIFEICEKFQISLAKARRMEKANVLRLDENTPDEIQEIRHLLMRGQPLSAAHLVALVENPGWTLDLGRYADKAQALVASLGNALDERAPLSVTAYIADAAGSDDAAQLAVINWMKRIIPAKPVPHNFVAVRLLLGVSLIDRKNDAPRIPRVLLNCRKRPEFAGWWQLIENGKRNSTIYCAPGKKPFDL
jgi:hypothetical protein